MTTARRGSPGSNKKPAARQIDIVVEDRFSVLLLRPLTSVGSEWIKSHAADDAQWFGNALACEGRYVEQIVKGAIEDGMWLNDAVFNLFEERKWNI
jgi:hypothetical protein